MPEYTHDCRFSEAPAPDMELRVLEGTVEACAFRDTAGRTCVLIVGVGPGACRAELMVPGSGPLTPCFNRVRTYEGDRLVFEGRDVCADVLYG